MSDELEKIRADNAADLAKRKADGRIPAKSEQQIATLLRLLDERDAEKANLKTQSDNIAAQRDALKAELEAEREHHGLLKVSYEHRCKLIKSCETALTETQASNEALKAQRDELAKAVDNMVRLDTDYDEKNDCYLVNGDAFRNVVSPQPTGGDDE